MEFRRSLLFAFGLIGAIQVSTCQGDVIVDEDFLGTAIDSAVWNVADPGAVFAVNGVLLVSDVSEAASGPSGWHEGFITRELPIGTDDFRFEIRFDFQSTTYQWLRVELLDAGNSVVAVMARISDPTQYVLSQSGPTEVLNSPNPASGPHTFAISRASAEMQFHWDAVLQGTATNTMDIARLRLSFGRWTGTEFGAVSVDRVYCHSGAMCYDRLVDANCDGVIDIIDVITTIEVAFRAKPLTEILPCVSPPGE